MTPELTTLNLQSSCRANMGTHLSNDQCLDVCPKCRPSLLLLPLLISSLGSCSTPASCDCLNTDFFFFKFLPIPFDNALSLFLHRKSQVLSKGWLFRSLSDSTPHLAGQTCFSPCSLIDLDLCSFCVLPEHVPPKCSAHQRVTKTD